MKLCPRNSSLSVRPSSTKSLVSVPKNSKWEEMYAENFPFGEGAQAAVGPKFSPLGGDGSLVSFGSGFLSFSF